MIRIDTIKLKAPIDSLVDYSSDHKHLQQTEKGVLIADKYVFEKPAFGIKSIHIDNLDNSIIVEASAKALKSNYYEMININTAEALVGAINDSGRIKVNYELINQAEVLKADFTQNLHPKQDLKNYFSMLSVIPISDKYTIDNYKAKGNAGVVYRGAQKTFKERIIFYDKSKDIARDKELKNNVPNHLLGKFAGVLRVETNMTQLSKIRQYTGKTNSLIDVLTSEHKPTLQVFDKITKNIDLRLFQEWEGMRLQDIEKLEGRKQIVKALGYDIGRIKNFINARVKGNTSRYIREYRNVLMNVLQVDEKAVKYSLADELRELMKAA